MFDFRKFVKDGIFEAIGNEPTYKTRRHAEAYYKAEILTDDDMVEIQSAIDAKYAEPEAETEVQE
jgi:hypothetical protein